MKRCTCFRHRLWSKQAGPLFRKRIPHWLISEYPWIHFFEIRGYFYVEADEGEDLCFDIDSGSDLDQFERRLAAKDIGRPDIRPEAKHAALSDVGDGLTAPHRLETAVGDLLYLRYVFFDFAFFFDRELSIAYTDPQSAGGERAAEDDSLRGRRDIDVAAGADDLAEDADVETASVVPVELPRGSKRSYCRTCLSQPR